MVYKNELDNIVWSFSTLHQYEQCPYAFYLKKIDNTEIPKRIAKAAGYK